MKVGLQVCYIFLSYLFKSFAWLSVAKGLKAIEPKWHLHVRKSGYFLQKPEMFKVNVVVGKGVVLCCLCVYRVWGPQVGHVMERVFCSWDVCMLHWKKSGQREGYVTEGGFVLANCLRQTSHGGGLLLRGKLPLAVLCVFVWAIGCEQVDALLAWEVWRVMGRTELSVVFHIFS